MIHRILQTDTLRRFAVSDVENRDCTCGLKAKAHLASHLKIIGKKPGVMHAF